LKGIRTLGLFPNDIKDGIDEFGTFRVVYRYVSKRYKFRKMDECHWKIVHSRPFAQLLPAPL